MELVRYTFPTWVVPLSNVIFIVDEAQNLTPHEVKAIITRAGENTKIIFTGDTLLSMGCGRVFEGTYLQMHKSILKFPFQIRLI